MKKIFFWFLLLLPAGAGAEIVPYTAALGWPAGSDTAVIVVRNLGPDPKLVTIEWWAAEVRPLPVWARTYQLKAGESRWFYFNRSDIGAPGTLLQGMASRFRSSNFSLHVNGLTGPLVIDGLLYKHLRGRQMIVIPINIRKTAPYSIPLR